MIDRELEYKDRKLKISLPIKDKVTHGFRDLEFLEKSLEHIEKDTTVIDCGSYTGNHSLFWSVFSRCSDIIAVEPFPETFRMLKETMQMNQCRNVTCLNFLLHDCDRNFSCVSMARALSSNTFFPKEDGEFKSKSLDEIVDMYAKNRVSFIKIDVEGMEHSVLRGAYRVLKDHHPVLHVEAHVSINKDISRDIYRSLKKFNYNKGKDLFVSKRRTHPHYRGYELKIKTKKSKR